MILNSVKNGQLIWPTVAEEDGTTRTKRYEELLVVEKLQADCDLKATNTVLQGFPSDVYAIINHHKVAKEIWDRVKLLMQGTKFSLQEKECLAVPIFNQGDDPIACLNKEMDFLIVVASSRFHSTNNQLRTSSNLKNQATIQDDRVTMQQVQGRQGQSYAGEGHMAKQCTRPKRTRNAAWFKEKAILVEAHAFSQILDEEQLAFLADLSILDGQAARTTILNTAAFQTEDLDVYDSDCDDVSNAKKSQRIKPTLYDGSAISSQHAASPMIDDEETLILEEVSRSKMLAKQNDPMSKEKKVNTTPINYVELNRLSKDFGKHFFPQQELSDEQAFWLQYSHPNSDQSISSPVKIEAPKELPKVSLVNTSLKKLKYHLGQFDIVVKNTLDAITEGEWGLNTLKLFF
ncbi:hypothetical protein Tco_1278665 [Tanacetum coccineum]